MTKYCFQHFENAYNIGWKNNHKSSKQEDYGKEFIEKLKVFCQYPVNKDLNGKFRYLDAKEGGKCVTGFGEIRIIDIKNNIRYAAPNIIVLDILDGLYFPPKEFIDAVMDCPEYASEEYKDFIRACTGSSYMIRNISLAQFYEYTSNMNDSEKIFLLPMVKITLEEKDELAKVIKLILSTADLQGCSIEDVCTCVLENNLE